MTFDYNRATEAWISCMDDCGAQSPLDVELSPRITGYGGDAAVFSQDMRYRYLLSRGQVLPTSPDVGVIMLNPSTADSFSDDPTIRRVRAFAGRLHHERGHSGVPRIVVANVYALRSTDPKALKTHRDPFGPDNAAALTWVIANSRNLIVAWGASLPVPERDSLPISHVQAQVQTYRNSGRPTWCLGVTKGNHPRHPLYLASDTPFDPWPHGSRHPDARFPDTDAP